MSHILTDRLLEVAVSSANCYGLSRARGLGVRIAIMRVTD